MDNVFELNGKKYKIKKPSLKATNEAELVYSRAMAEAISKPGFILKLQMDDWLKQKGIWDQEKEAQIEEYRVKLNSNLTKLEKGSIKLSDAKKLAEEAYAFRLTILALNSYKNSYNYMTAEAQAEGHKFSYLLSECLVDAESGKKVFNSYDDLLASDDEDLYELATDLLSDMLYGNTKEYIDNLPENKFLQKWGLENKEEVKNEIVPEPVFLDDEGNPIVKGEAVKSEAVTE